MRRDLSDLSGQYGKWVILHRVLGRNSTHYLCRCSCGKEQEIKAVNLVNGKTKCCGKKGCKVGSKRTPCIGDLSGSIWCHLKRSGEIRNIKVEISQQDAWDLFIKQNRRCALTDEPLTLGLGRQGNASLDRIDSNLPYVLNNVQWVTKQVNMMKRSLSQKDFIEVCKRIAQKFQGEYLIHSDLVQVAESPIPGND